MVLPSARVENRLVPPGGDERITFRRGGQRGRAGFSEEKKKGASLKRLQRRARSGLHVRATARPTTEGPAHLSLGGGFRGGRGVPHAAFLLGRAAGPDRRELLDVGIVRGLQTGPTFLATAASLDQAHQGQPQDRHAE